MCKRKLGHNIVIEMTENEETYDVVKPMRLADAKPVVPERPQYKTHLEYNVKLPTYEESQAKYAKFLQRPNMVEKK